MNRVILMGRLTDDAKMSSGGSGDKAWTMATFTLAVDRPGKDAGADFIRCTAFGARAEFVEKYTAKGQRILVEGSWRTGSYETKDKQTVYTNDVSVSNVEFADSKKDDSGSQKNGGGRYRR